MTRYALHFDPRAKREWDALDGSIKTQFKKVLARRLEHPHVLSARLTADLRDCYKIKLRDAGYRLVYRVDDGKILILVIAIDRRTGEAIYRDAARRA
ncbi:MULTISPECIES: type II toxin-antitoxin system RelE family toxin [Asaia]|uniref:Type II toxin-antitoxin system RelE/ParE family toxin n=1 Tax=Asaia spathodeae TaxID=657016 RepID=A0ABX2P890_9PROT|nr:type II toxin-antitoxin system RelE/ParE family toxin [Asaia spathodeae]GBR20455.1 translation repressor RelE/RelB/StbE [Asaia spathodeae NBRC 105894]